MLHIALCIVKYINEKQVNIFLKILELSIDYIFYLRLIAWFSWVNSWLIAINSTFLFFLNVSSINTFQIFYTLINMGMDKYGCFMQYMFIISETIVNIEHED